MLETDFNAVIENLKEKCRYSVMCNRTDTSKYQFDAVGCFDLSFKINEQGVIRASTDIYCTSIEISGYTDKYAILSLKKDDFVITSYKIAIKPSLSEKFAKICARLDKDVPIVDGMVHEYVLDYTKSKRWSVHLSESIYDDKPNIVATVYCGTNNIIRIVSDDIQIYESDQYYRLNFKSVEDNQFGEMILRKDKEKK